MIGYKIHIQKSSSNQFENAIGKDPIQIVTKTIRCLGMNLIKKV